MKLPSNNSGGIHVSSPSRSAAGIDVNALLPSSLLNESNVHKRLRKAAGSKDPAALPALLRDARISIPPLLLPILPADLLDDTAHDGRSALHMACWTGCISNVVLLLDMGCDMNIIATRSHNYGKSPIFFAATRGREDVMTLLLDRGANVLIVNNKGQSVYSIAASHFDESCELVGRIREAETSQMNPSMPFDGWVDYSKAHKDGNVYGDLDLRFLGRDLTDVDVVEDGVVNPTTRESRRGNFAKNNPHAYNSRKKKEDEDMGGKQARKKREERRPVAAGASSSSVATIVELSEGRWNDVRSALEHGSPWGLFSSLLAIVEVAESANVRILWASECAMRLEFLCDDAATTTTTTMTATAMTGGGRIESTLDEAIVFCGTGDRQATLVKRLLAKARRRDDDDEKGRAPSSSTRRGDELLLLENLWRDAEAALEEKSSRDAFVALMRVIVFLDRRKWPSWMVVSVAKLRDIIGLGSTEDDNALVEEILGYCDDNVGRRYSLLRRAIVKALDGDNYIENGIATYETTASRSVVRKKERALTHRYRSMIDSLQTSSTKDGPSFSILMSSPLAHSAGDETRYLSLPHSPTWVDSLDDLQRLRARLHKAIDVSNDSFGGEIRLDNFVSFDSEFTSAEDGRTKLATIQFSVLNEGIPLAWVVDLCPNPADAAYSSVSCDILRWLFLESDAQLLGFAHVHDIRHISSYLGVEIPLCSPKLWDLQQIAAHEMAKGGGNNCSPYSSLPGLKSCCTYFLETRDENHPRWELSKAEQCSDWARRPLTTNQLEYAGLDAGVLLILLAEIARG
jgi:hypothetical protein